MKLKELSSPIRVYWDIGSPSPGGDAFLLRICDELIENKVLSLNLTQQGDSLSGETLAVLYRLSQKPIAVSLTLTTGALNAGNLQLLSKLKLKAVLVTAASCEQLRRIEAFRRETGASGLGVSIELGRHNLARLPEILSFCITHQIVNLAFPMQRLTQGAECFSLSSAERTELVAALKGLQRPESVKILIHDPFLWRVFYPSIDFPDGGCQAANTMVYVSPEADLYPCPSLPIKIGSLRNEPFKQLILSQKKKDLRKVLAAPPEKCGNCDERHQCLGGCRGRTYRIKNSLSEPDPACK